MRDRSPSGPGMKVYTRETESRRNKCRRRDVGSGHHAVGNLLRVNRLSIQDEFGVEFSGSPASEYRTNLILTNSQKLAERTQIRCECDHLADIEVTVRPAV